jgi:transcription termination factor Rho
MSDVQLERSVLESKERDELFAIAVALGTAPEARTKKAELVSRILQVTGVEEMAPVPPAPRRTRSRKVVATASTAEVSNGEESTGQLALISANGGGEADDAKATGEARDAKDVDDMKGPSVARSSGSVGVVSAAGEQAQSGSGAEAESAAPSQSLVQGQPGELLELAPSFQRLEQGRQRFDVDPGLGNSRRRRRRNREKGGPRGTEREVPSQAAEPSYTGELVTCSGLLDLREEGYGFLRTNGYLASSSDVYVSITQVRRYGLRKGDVVEGGYRPAANNEKYPALVRVDSVGGMSPEEARNRPKFESLTPLFPDEKLRLEVPGDPANVTARIVDLISPIGKGQRGLIVSPPKAGKTTVLKQIAHSIEANNPVVHLMVLLVDERPD